jgi:hypothetical protein
MRSDGGEVVQGRNGDVRTSCEPMSRCLFLLAFAASSVFADVSGVGSGTVTWQAAPNCGPQRIATITFNASSGVVGTSTVTQASGLPLVSISYPVNGQKVAGQIVIQGSSASGCACTQTLSIDGKMVASGACGAISYQWFSTKAGKGKHTITLTAVNASGDSATQQINVTV